MSKIDKPRKIKAEYGKTDIFHYNDGLRDMETYYQSVLKDIVDDDVMRSLINSVIKELCVHDYTQWHTFRKSFEVKLIRAITSYIKGRFGDEA